MKQNEQILTLVAVVVLCIGAPTAVGQTVQEQEPESSMTQPRRPAGDPIRQLNLSPEQLEQIRVIRGQNQKERAAITQRVRETNRALEAVLEADTPDETLVEQRVREASAAQASAMRMRILTEVRIRKVLTTEQRSLLRTLRQEANQARRDRPLRNEERLRRREQRGLQNQRNGVIPLLPRRNLQRKGQPIDQQ